MSAPGHAIILFGHGSRDPLWRAPLDAVAQQLQAGAPTVVVRCAFLELTTPDLATVAQELVALGVRTVSVTPMFLGVGRHAREDLPQEVEALRRQYPGLQWTLQRAVGEDPRLLALLAEIAQNPAV